VVPADGEGSRGQVGGAVSLDGEPPIHSRVRVVRLASEVMLVRLRFPILVAGVVVLIAYWPWVRANWDRLTRLGSPTESTVSRDIEFWCPMCPGVVSDWPTKCPVCHMDLVRRTKGEAVPLPDGVVARMQLTPYRVQLAGIRTVPAEYLPLAWEAMAGGRLEQPDADRLEVPVDVPAHGLGSVRPGVACEVESDAFPGQTYSAHVREAGPRVDQESDTFRIRVTVEDPRHELKPGLFVKIRLRVPLAILESTARQDRDDWRNRTASDLVLHSLPAFGGPLPGLESLLDMATRTAGRLTGRTLAIPAPAVIDTGDRKVVFVERMAGIFDGIEVALGRRCGDHYPVLRGLVPGDRVVSAGAFLLDAETRLNPALAASYFGAGSRPSRSTTGAPPPATSDDEKLIARQKVCPVTDEPLGGSMGRPVKLVVEGRTVFICCKACERELRSEPKKYLAKLPK
jgi:membrane fusion protein, copper/silver efflux system